MVVRHGDSPVGHAARGVFLLYGSEGFAGFLVPKRMEHCHGAAELLLNRWVAGNGEADLTEFRWVSFGMLMLRKSRWHKYGVHTDKQRHADQVESQHAALQRSYVVSGIECP